MDFSLVIELIALRPWCGHWKYPIFRLLTCHLVEGGRLYSLFAFRPHLVSLKSGISNMNGVQGYEIEIVGLRIVLRKRGLTEE